MCIFVISQFLTNKFFIIERRLNFVFENQLIFKKLFISKLSSTLQRTLKLNPRW
jgi:hypothetical protein